MMWSEKKALAYLWRVLNKLDTELDVLATLVPQPPVDEQQFRSILRKLKWSPRRIRNAVDTIRYGRAGAAASFKGRRFIRNYKNTITLGTVFLMMTAVIYLAPITLVIPILLYWFVPEEVWQRLLLPTAKQTRSILSPPPLQLPAKRKKRLIKKKT